MKKLYFLFLAIFAGLIFISCDKSYTETVTYQINEPILMSTSDLRSSVKVTSTTNKIENYGKICFYKNFLYIAETGKGIHIINNTNPAQPSVVGFIELLGNYDMAIRNNTLYADMLTNLVWFDISNPSAPVAAGCMANAFPAFLPPCDNGYGYDYNLVYALQHNSDSVIVGWNTVERTEDVTRYRESWWGGIWNKSELYTAVPLTDSGNSTGVNGSMSSFALYNDYLYSVMNNKMTVISLTGAEPKIAADNIYIGYNVETIFSYKNAMFMGTPTGLLIYSVTNPIHPVLCSQISHVYGCDPVVVENDLAYVTVHSGNTCGQNDNELFVIDVSDIRSPQQLVSYKMTSPKGLGIDNGTLFVCDNGLKIFNAENPQTIIANQLAHYTGMNGYDVIPFNDVLMMIAEDGLYQYNYSDLNHIQLISKLKFNN
ncbi:MAG: hypothetical protein LBV75_06020 [Paludibacter sp.]|jgi:hypothetical protein|nr:hypothetical protein [Paludibacter sp.]